MAVSKQLSDKEYNRLKKKVLAGESLKASESDALRHHSNYLINLYNETEAGSAAQAEIELKQMEVWDLYCKDNAHENNSISWSKDEIEAAEEDLKRINIRSDAYIGVRADFYSKLKRKYSSQYSLAKKKRTEAEKNRDYFNKRIKEVNLSKDSYFEARKYIGNGKYGKITKMTRFQYLAHCMEEAKRWNNEFNKYNNQFKEATNQLNFINDLQTKYEAMLRKQAGNKPKQEVRPTVKADSKKGNAAKKQVRSSKKPPQTTVNKANNPTMPKEVEDYGKTLGQAYKLVTHADSKGNRIYAFEKDGKPAQVITQLKGQNPSKPLEVKSEGMIALMGQIAEAKKAQNSDFAELIGRINDQPTRDVINAAPKVKSEIKLPQQTPEIKIPEKIQTKPRVEVVYKTKKSGKQGKPQAIVLHDVNGKQFVLTPEIMENLAKKNKRSFFEKDMSDGKSRAEHTFKQYVEHIEKGDINVAGAVASFFKSEAEKPQMLTDAELKQQQAMIGNTVRGM